MANHNHADRYRDQLFIEIIADKLGFDTLADRLLGLDVYPPYLMVGVTLFIEYGVFDLYNYFITGKNSFVVEPNSLAVPALVILAVVGTRYIHDNYADSIAALRIEERTTDVGPELFEGLLSLRIRLLVYAVAATGIQVFNVFALGIGNLVQIDGVGLFVYGQLAFLIVYIPTITEFGLSYFAIHFVVPKRIEDAQVGVFFHDPRKMGGFQPIGELLKRSYYFYTAALILYFIQTKGPVILSRYTAAPYEPPETPIIEVVLSIGWIIGVLTIAYSMYRIHVLMKGDKTQRIRELEDELTDVMTDPYDIHSAEVTDQERYDVIQTRLQHVRDTKTYPTTFTMWSQIFVSVLLPQALNMAVQLP